MSIHIGKIIKDTLKRRQIDVADFAKNISYTRGNVYKIFNKPSIDTELLVKINKILGENLFFHYLKDEEIANYSNDKIKAAELMSALKDLKATMIELNEKKKSSKKVNQKKRKNKS